jgi:hypothetical protein
MLEIKAPQAYNLDKPSIFLAGTIEEGASEDWQAKVAAFFANDDVIILNPRRENWDASWEQEISNPNFKQQVEWELEAMERADIILFNFLPSSKSPISMLELGLMKDHKVFVCCPPEFWRRGNIEIVCEKYAIPVFSTLNLAIDAAKESVKIFNKIKI